MKTMLSAVCIAVAALFLQGCMAGSMPGPMTSLIYTHTWQPLSLDMHKTPAASSGAEGAIKHIGLHWASVAWDSAAIGEIARKRGINEVFFADLEVFSVLRIWNEYTVHVYGK